MNPMLPSGAIAYKRSGHAANRRSAALSMASTTSGIESPCRRAAICRAMRLERYTPAAPVAAYSKLMSTAVVSMMKSL